MGLHFIKMIEDCEGICSPCIKGIVKGQKKKKWKIQKWEENSPNSTTKRFSVATDGPSAPKSFLNGGVDSHASWTASAELLWMKQ